MLVDQYGNRLSSKPYPPPIPTPPMECSSCHRQGVDGGSPDCQCRFWHTVGSVVFLVAFVLVGLAVLIREAL